MSGFLNGVRGKVPPGCQAKRCKKNGCSLTMKGLQSKPLIVDMDCNELPISKNQSKCDYILFSDERGHKWMVPIEMKRGDVNLSEIKKQLQAGTDFAERKLLSQDTDVRLQPLAVYGGSLPRFVARQITKSQYKIKFRAKQYGIELRRSRQSLASVLT